MEWLEITQAIREPFLLQGIEPKITIELPELAWNNLKHFSQKLSTYDTEKATLITLMGVTYKNENLRNH